MAFLLSFIFVFSALTSIVSFFIAMLAPTTNGELRRRLVRVAAVSAALVLLAIGISKHEETAAPAGAARITSAESGVSASTAAPNFVPQVGIVATPRNGSLMQRGEHAEGASITPRSVEPTPTGGHAQLITPAVNVATLSKQSNQKANGFEFEVGECGYFGDENTVYCYAYVQNTRSHVRDVRLMCNGELFDSEGRVVGADHCWFGTDDGVHWADATLAPHIRYEMVMMYSVRSLKKPFRYHEITLREILDTGMREAKIGFSDIRCLPKSGKPPTVAMYVHVP